MTSRRGHFDSWDNNKVFSLLSKSGRYSGDVMISDGYSIQTSLLRVGNDLVECDCRVIGIAGMNVKVDFEWQVFSLVKLAIVLYNTVTN